MPFSYIEDLRDSPERDSSPNLRNATYAFLYMYRYTLYRLFTRSNLLRLISAFSMNLAIIRIAINFAIIYIYQTNNARTTLNKK